MTKYVHYKNAGATITLKIQKEHSKLCQNMFTTKILVLLSRNAICIKMSTSRSIPCLACFSHFIQVTLLSKRVISRSTGHASNASSFFFSAGSAFSLHISSIDTELHRGRLAKWHRWHALSPRRVLRNKQNSTRTVDKGQKDVGGLGATR